MSSSVENTNTCKHCNQPLETVGLDSSKCSKCSWINQPHQRSMPIDPVQSTRRKAASTQPEGTQLDLFGGL